MKATELRSVLQVSQHGHCVAVTEQSQKLQVYVQSDVCISLYASCCLLTKRTIQFLDCNKGLLWSLQGP